MKKIFVFCIMLFVTLTCSLTVFAKDDSVSAIDSGKLAADEKKASISYEERQIREAAYNEILTLSKTDKNIIAVKLSKDSRWVFLNISADKEKEYARKFDKYSNFLVFTDDVSKAEKNFNDDYTESGKTVGALNIPKDQKYDLWMIGAFGIVIFGAALLFARVKSHVPALQTANGRVITQHALISRKKIFAAVKQNEAAPDEKVFDSILQKIDHVKNNK